MMRRAGWEKELLSFLLLKFCLSIRRQEFLREKSAFRYFHKKLKFYIESRWFAWKFCINKSLVFLKRQCLQPALSPNLRWKVSSGATARVIKGTEYTNTGWRAHQGWICIWVWMEFFRPTQTLLLPSMRSKERETADLLRNCAFL